MFNIPQSGYKSVSLLESSFHSRTPKFVVIASSLKPWNMLKAQPTCMDEVILEQTLDPVLAGTSWPSSTATWSQSLPPATRSVSRMSETSPQPSSSASRPSTQSGEPGTGNILFGKPRVWIKILRHFWTKPDFVIFCHYNIITHGPAHYYETRKTFI